MATLEEILNNVQGVPDDLELDLPNVGKVKIGDVRRYRTAAVEQEKKVGERLKSLEQEQQRLQTLASQAAALNEELQKAKEQQPPASKTDTEDFENDALFGPLVKKRLSPMEKQMADIQKSIETLSKNYQESAKFVLNDYYERQWGRIPEAERPKDKSWKEYVRVAQERNLLGDFGLPDPVKAWQEETAPNREARVKKSAYDEGYQKAMEEARVQSRHIPRPGAMEVPRRPAAQEKNFGSIDEMIDAAFADGDILKAMEGTPTA